MVSEAVGIGMMFLDAQLRFVIQQAVQYMRRIAYRGGDSLDIVWRILIGEMRVEVNTRISAVPIILGAWAIGWLESLKPLRHSQGLFEIVGALLLILSGLYMLNAYFVLIPELSV